MLDLELVAVLGGDEARKCDYSSCDDVEVVIATAIGNAAEFHHFETPSRCSIDGRLTLQHHHSMRHTMELDILFQRCLVIDHQNRGAASREELLECQDLLSVPLRTLRQQTDLGKRVNHDARRL